MTQQQQNGADDFLMGGGAPSAKFGSVGDTHSGPITERPTVVQQRDFEDGELKLWNDGNPMMQLVVTIQTANRDPQIVDDDGTRRLFVKGAMKAAIQQAVKASGAKGLEVGGILTVTYTHDGEAKGRLNPPKQFRAEYVPSATAALSTPDPAPAVPAPAGTPAVPQPAPAAANPLAGLDLSNPAVAAALAQLAAQQQAAPAGPSAVAPF